MRSDAGLPLATTSDRSGMPSSRPISFASIPSFEWLLPSAYCDVHLRSESQMGTADGVFGKILIAATSLFAALLRLGAHD
jgi:hypothetical protein